MNIDYETRLLLIRVGVVAALTVGIHSALAAVWFAVEVLKTPLRSLKSLLMLVVAAGVATLVAKTLEVNSVEIPLSSNEFIPFTDWLGLIPITLVIAMSAALFHVLLLQATRIGGSFAIRMVPVLMLTIVGVVLLPEGLGIGFNTLEQVATGQFIEGVFWLLTLAVVRLVINALTIGLGLPLGLIGVNFVNGGLLGAAGYLLMQLLIPEWVTAPMGVYIALGATTMIGCTLNAPITVCILFFEFSFNFIASLQVAPLIFMAYFCKIKLLGRDSVFEARLAAQGIHVRDQFSRLSVKQS